MPDSTLSKGPGVPFPPPLPFVVAFLIGLGIEQLAPVDMLPDGVRAVGPIAAIAILVAGGLIGFWALISFLRARTAIIPHRPASQLVTIGPFRFSHNPMYVGLTLLYLSVGLWVNSIWPLLMLPLAAWSLWKLVIQKEEAYLTAEFGKEYGTYRESARQWI